MFRVLERARSFEALARGAGPPLTGRSASEPARSTGFEHGPRRDGTRIEGTRGRLARVRRSHFGSRRRFRDDRLLGVGGLRHVPEHRRPAPRPGLDARERRRGRDGFLSRHLGGHPDFLARATEHAPFVARRVPERRRQRTRLARLPGRVERRLRRRRRRGDARPHQTADAAHAEPAVLLRAGRARAAQLRAAYGVQRPRARGGRMRRRERSPRRSGGKKKRRGGTRKRDRGPRTAIVLRRASSVRERRGRRRVREPGGRRGGILALRRQPQRDRAAVRYENLARLARIARRRPQREPKPRSSRRDAQRTRSR